MTSLKILIPGILAICTVTATAAGFVAVDDFDALVLGPIHGQNGWYAADATNTVKTDPSDIGNRVLSVTTASTYLFHEAIVPQGEARMVFLRFRFEDQLSISFGLSTAQYPTQFGDFEPELGLSNSNDDLRINDDGSYAELATLDPGVWYNCWFYIDNAADVSSVWLHDRAGDHATAADQLVIDGRTEFPFRQGTTWDLRNVFVKTGGGVGLVGPLLMDDLYLHDADVVDLANPTVVTTDVAVPSAGFRLGGAAPNPFNPQTRIAFTLDAPQTIELAVYDLGGRRVRMLESGVREAGQYAVSWDGRDRSGAAMGSGTYVARLVGKDAVRTAKLVLVR